MTRKHFIRIAAALRRTQASKKVCQELAAEFTRFNTAFDFRRFMTACGH